MGLRGDCLSCARLGICRETDLEKVINSYTCPVYQPVPEEVYEARITTMEMFGERVAVEAMLSPKQKGNEDSD